MPIVDSVCGLSIAHVVWWVRMIQCDSKAFFVVRGALKNKNIIIEFYDCAVAFYNLNLFTEMKLEIAMIDQNCTKRWSLAIRGAAYRLRMSSGGLG